MIQGELKETRQTRQEYPKKVGLFEAEVIAINPTAEEFKEVLNINLPEDSKATEYLKKTKNGETRLQLEVWLKDVETDEKRKMVFLLDDKEVHSNDGFKTKYINNVGKCTWASDPNLLGEWFTANRDYRVAYRGEEELYEFLRTWLGKIDYTKEKSVLQFEWRKFMKGNVKDLKDQVNGAYCVPFLALATVSTREVDGEVKEYQNVYNAAFLPVGTMKYFNNTDYNNRSLQNELLSKKSDLKVHERFVKKVVGSYGCRDYYIFGKLRDYNKNENMMATDSVIADDDSKF